MQSAGAGYQDDPEGPKGPSVKQRVMGCTECRVLGVGHKGIYAYIYIYIYAYYIHMYIYACRR